LHPRRLPQARKLRPDHGTYRVTDCRHASADRTTTALRGTACVADCELVATTGRAVTRRCASLDRTTVCALAAETCCRVARGRVTTTGRRPRREHRSRRRTRPHRGHLYVGGGGGGHQPPDLTNKASLELRDGLLGFNKIRLRIVDLCFKTSLRRSRSAQGQTRASDVRGLLRSSAKRYAASGTPVPS